MLPKLRYLEKEAFDGNPFVDGGRAWKSGGAMESADATVVVYTEKDGVRTVLRDLGEQGEVTVEADGDGGYTVRAYTGDTDGWYAAARAADGYVYSDVKVTYDGEGPWTVQRTRWRLVR